MASGKTVSGIFLICGVTMDVPSLDLFIGGRIPGLSVVIALVGSAVVLTGKTEPGVGFAEFEAKQVAVVVSAAETLQGSHPIALTTVGINVQFVG